MSKDLLLYLAFCALGAALSRLFNFPLWLYPLFSTLVAYGITMVKKIVIDETEPKDAFKGSVLEGIALVAGVDRVFDMGRTVVNITGDASCTVVVSNLERKKAARKKAKETEKKLTDSE